MVGIQLRPCTYVLGKLPPVELQRQPYGSDFNHLLENTFTQAAVHMYVHTGTQRYTRNPMEVYSVFCFVFFCFVVLLILKRGLAT